MHHLTLSKMILLAGVASVLLMWTDSSLARSPKQLKFGPKSGVAAPTQPAQPNPKGNSQESSSLSLGQDGGQDEGGAKSVSVFDRLVREIDNLIPGELEKNPQRKQMVEEAIKAFQARNAEKTVEIFNQMTASEPYLPPTDMLLASLSFIVSDQTTGRILLERAARDYPKNLGISSVFLRLAINEGRVNDGVAHLEKFQRLLSAPEVPGETREFYTKEYLNSAIDIAMRQKRFADARSLLEQRRGKYPESTKSQLVAAELEFSENKIDKSLEYLRALKVESPKARAPESILASWYLRRGDKANSEKWIIDAARKYPDDSQVQLEYASWAISNEDFALASKSIAAAEQSGKETNFSRNLKGKIAFAKGAYAVSLNHYQALAAANPDNIDVMNMLALSLIESTSESNRKKALEVAVNNYRRAPGNLVSRSALGYIQLRSGELEKAKGALAMGAKAQRGASLEIDFFVASVLNAMNQKDKARLVLDTAVRREGFFLYRSPAKKLLNDLGGPLPDPPTAK